MNTRNLATTAAVMVTMAACSVASVTAWLMVTSPTTVALAVKGSDAQPLAEFALHALYTVIASLVRYL
jgi:cytochrome c-type biogenesis protein CcmH/NrfG